MRQKNLRHVLSLPKLTLILLSNDILHATVVAWKDSLLATTVLETINIWPRRCSSGGVAANKQKKGFGGKGEILINYYSAACNNEKVLNPNDFFAPNSLHNFYHWSLNSSILKIFWACNNKQDGVE